MLIQSLRPQKFADVVGNQLNNKILMALAHKPDQSPSTLLLQGHFGSGKAIDVNSVLPTPNGNKRAGDIQLGEVLFSRTGQPTQVIGVYPNGLKDSYKVMFEDGRIVYCNTEHNWTIINNRTHQFETKTLQEIMDYIALTHSKVSIPLNLPVVHPEQELSITPYTLGLLLANAKYERGTILYPNNNQKYIASVVKENTRFWWDVLTNKVYRFPRDKEGNPVSPKDFYGDLYTEIVNQQTIPQQYLYASIDQRWELLQGIMDSLATISNDNNIFCSIPETLLDNFIILVHSLGLVVTVIEGQSPVTVLFKTDSAIIRKLFKNHRILKVPYNNVHFSSVESLTILSIEKEEEQREMVCFEVDNPEHLYLCNDYIVTHNTTSARLFAKALNCKKLGDNDICGKCENCKADLNCVPWYNEFDSSMLNVDSIRDMRDILLSTSNNYKKVVILDECHLLSKQSLSALLKVFEESPKNIFYLLATTDPEKLLPTIRSRSLELVFTTKTSDEVKKDIDKHAKALGIELSDTTLSLIATRSKGIMRNAHMLLDKVVLLGEKEFLNSDISTVQPMYNYIVSLLKSDKKGVLDAVSELSRLPVTYLKEDWQEFFLSLIKASIDQSTTQEEKIIKLASALPKAQVASLVRTCTADWVIKSFQSAVHAQAAMLSIFQMLSK